MMKLILIEEHEQVNFCIKFGLNQVGDTKVDIRGKQVIITFV